MRHIAKALAAQGRGPDTELIHVTKPELAALNRLSETAGLGGLTTNPTTGLPEASLLGTILPIVGMAAGAVLAGPAGAEMGGAAGGALGGYAGAKLNHTNPFTGALLGGVGGYFAGGSDLFAAPADKAAAMDYAGGYSAAPKAAVPIAPQTPVPAVAPAPTMSPSQFSASIDRVNPWTGEVAPQALPAGGMQTTGPISPDYWSANNISASHVPTAAPDSSGVMSWVGKHPMESYLLGTAGSPTLLPKQNNQAQMHDVTLPGQSHNQRQYMGAVAGPGEQNYFAGNSLYNYSQDPGTTVRRYADGGTVAPKYTMSGLGSLPQAIATPNAVQYGAGNNATMPIAPNLQAPIQAAQLAASPNGGTYTLPAPTATDWYAQAADLSPTAQKIKADAAAAAAEAEKAKQLARYPIVPVAGYARGGVTSLPPHMIHGAGDGMSDSIPAAITDGGAPKEEIRVASGEYIVPADVVAHLGNGSSDAGAKHLDKTMAKIRKARTGNPKQGRQIKPEKFI